MSGGPRPPVPGLIPLAALSRRPGRPRRRPESIDAGAGSRCLESRAAAPGRRHHHRRRASAAAAVSKQSRSSSPALERPPRVNPIFVWVRQEDTRIVDVKCEDYDKRNRILLTKTAHGWRAIPRTEMLAAPRASAEEVPSSPTAAPSHGHHHRNHHKRRSRKSKNQQSAAVQFPESGDPVSEPSWVTSENVNIESLLPSHTIQIKRIPSSDDLPKSVNSASEQEFARTIPECSTPDKVCDVSPLENLLAVAELELKQHMQSGNWNSVSIPDQNPKETTENENIDEIAEILQTESEEIQADLMNTENKGQDCSYNDDDEMSMNDILSRLEQSLQSPHEFGSDNTFDDEMLEGNCKFDKDFSLSEENDKPIITEPVSVPEQPNNFEIDIKEEYTDTELIGYTDLYSDENKMSQILEAVKCLEPSEIKEDCALEEPADTENECTQIFDDAECKLENTEIETDVKDASIFIDEDQDNKSQETEEDQQKDSEPASDCIIISSASDPAYYQTEPEENCHQISCEEPDIKDKSKTEKAGKTERSVAEAESSIVQEGQLVLPEHEAAKSEVPICLDLSIKNRPNLTADTNKESSKAQDIEDGPTDLCIRKPESSPKLQPQRPPSQNSEAIQSPEPSGIPAVPASPDIVSTTTTPKPRSVFLESLLANSINKASTSSTSMTSKPKEPLDLGHCRKSASPTVTCSEEIVTPSSESEPPLKKLKPDDITLKNLLDKDIDMVEHSPKKVSTKETPILPDTPRLLSLLKASSDTQDPLAEYKQLLLEIDIPNPLMVPKDVFPDLLKHPRREILKILSGHSSKNVALDDILVVYKDKLLAAIESSHNNSTLTETGKNSESPKANSKQTVSKPMEQNNNISEKNSPAHIGNKRRSTDNSNKRSVVSPENKNTLANDIDAANEAAFNPLFWAGYPNPFEAMSNYASHNEFFQALYAASSLPYLPGQLGELHPGLQMMLGNKMSSPVGFPSNPQVNFNNSFELSMWQEAMMQASLLKNKNPYENTSLNQQTHRPSIQKKNHIQPNHLNKYNPRVPNGHSKNISQAQQIQQQSMMPPSFSQAGLSSQSGWPNPYLGLGGFQQGNNSLALDTTQFNPFSHKNSLSPTSKHSQQLSPPILQKKCKEPNIFSQYSEQEKRLQLQMMQEHQKMQQIQQQNLFRQQQQQQLLQHQQQMMRQSNGAKQLLSPLGKKANSLGHFNFSRDQLQEKFSIEMQKQAGLPVPMDLSGVQSVHSKSKATLSGSGKSNAMVTSTRNLMEDMPEVGSTTGSIEDMQDSHAQLWHPLFGSQNKGYNPWNLPSLAAMGE